MSNRTCSDDGCEKPVVSRGYCKTGYMRWFRNRKEGPRCSVEPCDGAAYIKGLCQKHDSRLRAHGTVADPVYIGADERRRRRNARTRARRARDRDRVRAYNAAYYAANRARNASRCAAWRARNADRHAANGRRWRMANPMRVRSRLAAKNARRYAHIRATRVGPVDYAAILAEYGMWCHVCHRPIPSRRFLHFDHVIPLARGGAHVADNIRPAHARCNQKKGAKIGAFAGSQSAMAAAV